MTFIDLDFLEFSVIGGLVFLCLFVLFLLWEGGDDK